MADRVLEYAMAKKGLGVPVAESKNVLNQLAEQDAAAAEKLKKMQSSIKQQKKDEKAAAWESGSVKQKGRTSGGNTLNGIGEYFLYGVGKGVQNITLDNVNAQKLQALQRTTMIYEDMAQKEIEKYGSASERTANALLKARAAEQQELSEQQKFYGAPDDYSVLAEKYPASEAKQGVYDASSALGSLGVSMLAGAAGKGMGANAPSLGKLSAMTPAVMAQARGGAYGQAIAEGAEAEEARAYADRSGAKEGAIEALFGFAGPLSKIAGKGVLGKPAGQALGKVLGKAAGELPNNSLKNVALNTWKGAAGEGAEEALSGAIDPYLQRATYNPEAENATAEELAYQAAIGMALGTILGGGSNVLDYRLNKGTKKAAQGAEIGAGQAQTQSTINNTTAEKDGLKGEYGASISPNEGGIQGPETYSASQKPDTQTDNVYAQAYEEMMTGKGAAEKKALSEDEKKVKRFIQSAAVGARLDVKYEDLPTSRRAYYADGVLHINKNKLNEGMKVTAAHEIYHALEGTKEHEAVVELAIKARGGNAQELIAQKIAEYARAGVTLDEAGARAEIGAEFIEKAMSDEATINQVLLENRTLAQRILQWIKDMVAVFEKRKTMSAEDLAEYKALLKARQLYEQGLAKLHEGKYEPAGVERNAANRDSNPYSYDNLIRQKDMDISALPKTGVMIVNDRGDIDVKEIVQAVYRKCKQITGKGGTKYNYAPIGNTGLNAIIDTKSVKHAYASDVRKDKVTDLAIEKAELAQYLPYFMENAIVVNEKGSRTDDGDNNLVLISVHKTQKDNEIAVARIVIDKKNNYEAILKDNNVIGRVYAINAKKINLNSMATSRLPFSPSSHSSLSEMTIADVLDIVKEVFPDTLSKDVYDSYKMTRKSTAFSDGDKRYDKKDGLRFAIDTDGALDLPQDKSGNVGYRFFDNTFQNTPIFDDAVKEIERSYEHERTRVSEKENIAEARRRLKENGWYKEMDTVLKKDSVDGADTDVAMAIISQLNNYETDSAEFGRIMKFAEDYAEKTVESGQFIQSLAKYTRTAAGKTQKAMRDIKHEEEKLKKENPKKWNEAQRKAAKARKTYKDAQDEALEEALATIADTLDNDTAAGIINNKAKKKEKKEPSDAEKLAGKVKGQVNRAFADTVDNAQFQKDIINELYRLAKESPLPDKAVNVQKKDYVSIMREILQNQDKYADVWQDAREIVAKKYRDDPAKMAALEDYFDNYIVPIYSQESMKKAIKDIMAELKIDISDVIIGSKGDKQAVKEEVRKVLSERLGLETLDAQTVDIVTNDIFNSYDKILKKKAQSRMEAFLKEEVKDVKKRGSVAGQMMRMIRNGYFSEEEAERIIKKAFDVPTLTTEEVRAVLSHYEQAEAFPEGSYERRKWEAKAQQIINDKTPKSFSEKNKTLRRIAMLTNPATWWRNIGGNVIFTGAEMVKNVPAALTDMAVSKVTGKRTTDINVLADAKAYAKGFKRGGTEWWNDVKYGVDTSHNAVREEYQAGGKVFDDKHWYGRVANKADTVMSKALQLGDRPFYEAAYDQRLSELKRLGYDTESEAVQAEAKIYALERVYQNDSKISEALTTVRNKLGLFGHFLIPFTQTPGNLLDKCIDYSGAGGIARALVQLGQAKQTGVFDQKLFVDRIGRAFTGLGTMVFGAFLSSIGALVGSDDEDYKVAGAKRLAGEKEYSLHIGNAYYTIDWAQPVSAVLIAGAEAHKAGLEADDWDQIAIASGKGVINTLFSLSCLEGLESMMKSYGEADPADKISDVMISGISQYFPTTLRRLNNVIDPIQRQTYDPNPLIAEGKYILSGVPGASYLLEPKYTLEGEVQMKSQGRGAGRRIIENFFVPYNTAEEYHSEVNDELLRIYEKTGEKTQFLHYAQKKLDYGDGGKYVLEPADYNRMQTEIGQNVTKADKELMRSSVYKSMSDAEKAKALGEIATFYDNKYKEDYAKKHGIEFSNDSYSSLKKKVDDAGGWVGYFEVKQAFPDQSYETAKKRKETCDRYGINYTAYAESGAKISELKTANSARYEKAGDKTEANKRDIARYLASRRDLTDPQRQVLWEEIGNYKDTYKQTARRYGL